MTVSLSRVGRRRGGSFVESRCRVWIVRYGGWQPQQWSDLPAEAIAVEPAEPGTMTARQACRYVEAFNRAVLGGRQKVWAVALPVAVRYLGDPQPGERIMPDAVTQADCGKFAPAARNEKSPLLACQVSAGNGLPPRDRT
jgi:hypothetical protein